MFRNLEDGQRPVTFLTFYDLVRTSLFCSVLFSPHCILQCICWKYCDQKRNKEKSRHPQYLVRRQRANSGNGLVRSEMPHSAKVLLVSAPVGCSMGCFRSWCPLCKTSFQKFWLCPYGSSSVKFLGFLQGTIARNLVGILRGFFKPSKWRPKLWEN